MFVIVWQFEVQPKHAVEFENSFHKEYKALDSTFERLTVSETRLGTFVAD